MLDDKIDLQHKLLQLTEDLNDARALATRHREEIIKLQIKFSQLITLEEKSKVELETLVKENEFYIKKNVEFEADNEKLNKEILAHLQKIDINTLLKEIDIEDLRLIAQGNKAMTSALHQMLNKWETIQKE